uniref:Uncharacterized protein n=1 Tax=Anguilla anguilla TaxID=7936 RepID=A0A0E9PRZ2_ANGAN
MSWIIHSLTKYATSEGDIDKQFNQIRTN